MDKVKRVSTSDEFLGEIDSQVIRYVWMTGNAKYENRILDDYNIATTWTDFVIRALEVGHLVTDDKEDSPFIIPCTFRAFNEGAIPAKFTFKDEEKGRGIEGEPKTDSEGGFYIGRCAKNVNYWYLLPVDIDGGITLDEAKARYQEYEYIGYTSHNHLNPDEGAIDKCRLLILIKGRVCHSEFKKRKTALNDFIKGADKTTLYGSRGFYFASCPKSREHLSEIWHNKGKPLDVMSLKKDEVIEQKKNNNNDYYNEQTDDERSDLLNDLRNIDMGYDKWWQMVAALKTCGFGFNDLVSISAGNPSHSSGSYKEKTSSNMQGRWNNATVDTNEDRAWGKLYKITGARSAQKTKVSINPIIEFVKNAKAALNIDQQEMEQEFGKNQKLESYKDEVFYNDKFCRSLGRESGTYFSKSFKGSGKTYQMNKLVELLKTIDEIKQAGKSVLVIGHRVTLLESFSEKLNIEFYKNFDDYNIDSDYLAICVNSLKRIGQKLLFNPYDVVIIDESEQVLEHWASGGGDESSTIKAKDRPAISRHFVSAIEKAKSVYCLDADLGMLTINVITAIREDDVENANLYGDINLYQQENKTVNLWLSKNALINELTQWVAMGDSVFIATNNKKFNGRLAEQLASHTSTTIHNIHADNAGNKKSKEVLNRLNVDDTKANVILITSPSVGTGYDIQAHFDHVVGIFDKDRTTHWDMDQHVSRVRNTDVMDVFIAPLAKPKKDEEPTIVLKKQDMQNWYEYLEANYDELRRKYPLDFLPDDSEKDKKWYKILLNCKMLTLAKCDAAKKNPKHLFRKLKESQNFVINEVDDEAGKSELDLKGKDREKLKAGLLAIVPIEKNELYLYHNTPEELRFIIEQFFNVSIDDNIEIVDWWYDKRDLLFKYRFMLLDAGALIKLDAEQGSHHVIDRKNYYYSFTLLKDFLSLFDINNVQDIGEQCNPVLHNQDSKVKKFKTWYEGNKINVNRYLNKKIYSDIDKNLFRAIRVLCAECGLVLKNTGKRRIEGVNTRLFSIDLDDLQWVRDHQSLIDKP